MTHDTAKRRIKGALQILNQIDADDHTHRCNKCLKKGYRKQRRGTFRCECGGTFYPVMK